MHVISEESFDVGQNSSVQTTIDMHIEEVYQTSEVVIAYFDEWIHFFVQYNMFQF